MNADMLTNNWALIFAVVPALIVVVVVLRYLIGRTGSGQLQQVVSGYRESLKEWKKAQIVTQKKVARIEKLKSKAERTIPRLLEEAREAEEDARSLEKIAHDRVLVAATHVRRVIHDEFPPIRQEKLRNKYLSELGNGGPA